MAQVKTEVKKEASGSLPRGRLHLRRPKKEEDAPGQHHLVGRSVDEDNRQMT
jgi:hypothetical protein